MTVLIIGNRDSLISYGCEPRLIDFSNVDRLKFEIGAYLRINLAVPEKEIQEFVDHHFDFTDEDTKEMGFDFQVSARFSNNSTVKIQDVYNPIKEKYNRLIYDHTFSQELQNIKNSLDHANRSFWDLKEKLKAIGVKDVLIQKELDDLGWNLSSAIVTLDQDSITDLPFAMKFAQHIGSRFERLENMISSLKKS